MALFSISVCVHISHFGEKYEKRKKREKSFSHLYVDDLFQPPVITSKQNKIGIQKKRETTKCKNIANFFHFVKVRLCFVKNGDRMSTQFKKKKKSLVPNKSNCDQLRKKNKLKNIEKEPHLCPASPDDDVTQFIRPYR